MYQKRSNSWYENTLFLKSDEAMSTTKRYTPALLRMSEKALFRKRILRKVKADVLMLFFEVSSRLMKHIVSQTTRPETWTWPPLGLKKIKVYYSTKEGHRHGRQAVVKVFSVLCEIKKPWFRRLLCERAKQSLLWGSSNLKETLVCRNDISFPGYITLKKVANHTLQFRNL